MIPATAYVALAVVVVAALAWDVARRWLNARAQDVTAARYDELRDTCEAIDSVASEACGRLSDRLDEVEARIEARSDEASTRHDDVNRRLVVVENEVAKRAAFENFHRPRRRSA